MGLAYTFRFAACCMAALGAVACPQVAAQEAAASQPLSPAAGAAAARDGSSPDAADAEERLCELIETAASDNDIPIEFFTRLLWKESSFRSNVVSPKGAQGIAQFMPTTAAERGLLDPFDTTAAIAASAYLLADLHAKFGNLGLAAAAYNAGVQRVTDWLAEETTLPIETQDYVLWITGTTAETWASADEIPETAADTEEKDCLTLVTLFKVPGLDLGPELETATGPWGVQVAGNFSRARAISAYATLQMRFPSILAGHPPMIISGRMAGRGTRAFYQVRVPMQTRQDAEQLCADFKSVGGSCIVLKT